MEIRPHKRNGVCRTVTGIRAGLTRLELNVGVNLEPGSLKDCSHLIRHHSRLRDRAPRTVAASQGCRTRQGVLGLYSSVCRYENPEGIRVGTGLTRVTGSRALNSEAHDETGDHVT